MKRRTHLILPLLLLTCAVHAAGLYPVRIGYQKGGGLMALIKSQGTLDKTLAANGYKASWYEFPAGPQMLEALNAGAIDLATTGGPAPIFAQAGGYDIVYVGAEPGTLAGEAVIVPEHSAIRGAAELKGKKIAFQKGSGSHYLLLATLKKAD